MRYTAEFYGRRKGAIGERYLIWTTVEGDTPDAARLALYADYEHISGLRLVPSPAIPDGER